MSLIMTENGWRRLERECIHPVHVPSLLEQLGLLPDLEGKVADQYRQGIHDYLDSKITHEYLLVVMGSKNLIT